MPEGQSVKGKLPKIAWVSEAETMKNKGDIDQKYKEAISKLSREFRQILEKFDIPHAVMAHLSGNGWRKAMDFGDRFSSQEHAMEIAAEWIGFDDWTSESTQMQLSIWISQVVRECKHVVKMEYERPTPEKEPRPTTTHALSATSALIMADKRKHLEMLWGQNEKDDFPDPRRQPSDNLIKIIWASLEKGEVPVLEWKHLTFKIPSIEKGEFPEYETMNGKRQKTGNNVAQIPKTMKEWKGGLGSGTAHSEW